jgi:hypothetical protein
MSAPQRKSRPAGETAGAADRDRKASPAYDQAGGKASSTNSDPFAAFKWAWLDQVAADPSLPPAAHRIAILIAGRHLNRKLGKAWPGVETLAANLSIKAPNTIRTALKAMEAGGHMFVEWSTGGKNQTNHFYPLVAGEPFKKLKGIENPNPSNFDGETLQNRNTKPFKDLKGNPLMEPSDEPKQAPIAPAMGDHSQSNRSTTGQPDTRIRASGPDPTSRFKIGDEVELSIDGKELSRPIVDIGTDAAGSTFVMVTAEYGIGDANWIVPIDGTGRLRHRNGWWEPDAREGATPIVRWGAEIGNPAPRTRRQRHAAA